MTNWFFYHGYLVHPPIWTMWMSGLLTPVNTLVILWLMVRKRGGQ